jgi:hypothetical protein
MDYPLRKRGPLFHPGDPIHASDHYSMSKEWMDYHQHGENVKDPYYAHKKKSTPVVPQQKRKVVNPIGKTKVETFDNTRNGWPLI